MVLVPLAAVSAVMGLVGFALSKCFGPDGAGSISRITFGLAIGLSVLWLMSYRMIAHSRVASFFLAAVIMAAVGILTAVCANGMSGSTITHTIVHMICTAVLLLAMTLAGLFCRRRYSAWRFTGWLALSCIMICLLVAMPFAGLAMISMAAFSNGPGMIFIMLTGFLVWTFVMSLLLFGLLISFMALAFRSALYRERFYGSFRLKSMISESQH